jgi:hypothetical protein
VLFKSGDRILTISKGLWVAHPLLVTRYPLAMLGLLLTIPACFWMKRSRTGRYLVLVTLSVIVLAFTPGIAGITSAAVTKKMLYRLSWLFPWGFTIAFVLGRTRLRVRWSWLIAIALTIGLCKGNPVNYTKVLTQFSGVGKPGPEYSDALRELSVEPSPRGVVLAPTNLALMIPAHVPGAYPAFVSPAYSTVRRSEAVKTNRDMRNQLQAGSMDTATRQTIRELGARYILIESSRALNRALKREGGGFEEAYSNRTFTLWRAIGEPGMAGWTLCRRQAGSLREQEHGPGHAGRSAL